MPYIQMDSRIRVANQGDPQTAGELNYVLTAMILGYMQRKGLNYQTINDIVGALEGAKAEFQRRVVAPYEDRKASENGDIYAEGARI